MALTYEGLGQSNKWVRMETYSGKLVENITQATARDLLAEAMWRMEQAGLAIVGHVHDEVILEVRENSATVDDICTVMNQNPVWADGLPLASAGYSGSYYFKD
jgi:DNA polymerase